MSDRRSTWLWFRTPTSLAHAFTPLLRLSACGAFEWSSLWEQGAEERCAGCVTATREMG